jgi:hypothetical protein
VASRTVLWLRGFPLAVEHGGRISSADISATSRAAVAGLLEESSVETSRRYSREGRIGDGGGFCVTSRGSSAAASGGRCRHGFSAMIDGF